MSTKPKGWGFDPKELDAKIRPQDDFYHHVNKKWMRVNPIPKSEARWGSFVMLRYDTDKKLKKILDEVESARGLKKGSPEQMIRDFYRSGMDMKRRNALGAKPLAPWRSKVAKVRSKGDLLKLIAEFHKVGLDALWAGFVDQDAKNSTRYALHMVQDGLGMPDRDYYLKDDAESVRVRNAYKTHGVRLLKLIGYSTGDATRRMESILTTETALARISMKKEDSRDAEKTYHKFTRPQLEKLAPGMDWKRYFAYVGVGELPYFIVMQPEFYAGVSKLLDSISIEDWKIYLEFHAVSSLAGALSQPFIREQFSFYGTVLSGTKVMKPLWRRILGSVNGNLGEVLGQIYVKKHFPPEAKKKMNILVDDLFTAYAARIKGLDWMSPKTKKKALLKLRSLNRKIGYPDKWKSYRGLVVRPDEYLGNLMRSSAFEHRRQLKKLRGPIDRDEWFMYPQTVNAYFAPNLNDIAFPAAILQAPFFSHTADDAVNYGAIGAVIGHEITHGFDDQGSKFDEKGNLKSWWTSGDRKRFERKAERVRKQFDQYTVADGVKVNGKLTLGENIADLGGLSIALDAYQLQLKRTGRKDIDGLTPEQRFFLAFAIFERENARPEFVKSQVLTDPHAPGIFRINGPVSNLDAFYEAYGITKKDKMYRLPSAREMVW
ncbi:MAG: M13 family metallopeptidase [Patescibacteria group bacterium]